MRRVPETLEHACPREQLTAAQTEYHSILPDTMLLGFADYEAPARRLAEVLHFRYRTVAGGEGNVLALVAKIGRGQRDALHAGEAVSQRIVGGGLGRLFDTVVTVDPHLHRIRELSEVI